MINTIKMLNNLTDEMTIFFAYAYDPEYKINIGFRKEGDDIRTGDIPWLIAGDAYVCNNRIGSVTDMISNIDKARIFLRAQSFIESRTIQVQIGEYSCSNLRKKSNDVYLIDVKREGD